jgi:hypothetical protein
MNLSMIRKGLLTLLILTGGYSNAQNLVPNGDFEQYIACPVNFGEIDSVLYWMNPMLSILVGGNGGTPDYFNQCNTTASLSVPDNALGFQQAHSGVGYAGIILWYGPVQNYREYIEVALLEPLHANKCYQFEMFINLSDVSQFTTDAIGVYFSDTIFSGINNWNPIPVTPQLFNATGNVFDTLKWKSLTMNYTATGGEQYLIIGNYNSDLNTPLDPSLPTGTDHSFVYIDDVSVTTCKGTEVDAVNGEYEVNLFPNPVTDYLNVNVNKNELSEITLYDITSRILSTFSFYNYTSIDMRFFPKGVYIFEIINENGIIKKGRIIKE